ncbi:MAG: hypothetical protein NTV63_03375 [Candidatus Woesearchaeota archaeon]|nr:hypothetical protein [Candidatus Woesearchaeota archaeon]
MEEVVRQDVLSVLDGAEKLVVEENSLSLKELSNHTIHNASIFQDDDSIIAAVLIYSLSKIMERAHESQIKKKIATMISAARNNLMLGRIQEYRDIMKDIMNLISEIDSKIKIYIEEVISQAKIKKGSRIYEHGISAARAAEILGISQWELMGYIGNTVSSENISTGRAKKRLLFARELFK